MQNGTSETNFDRILEKLLEQEFYGPLRKTARGRSTNENFYQVDKSFYSLMASSFFDPKVQRVVDKHFNRLKQIGPSIPINESANRFLSGFKEISNRPDIETLCLMEMHAFPIRTWNVLNQLASDTFGHVWSLGYEDVIYCYQRAPLFCADLLTILTEYHARPEHKRTIGEWLAHNVTGLRSNVDSRSVWASRFGNSGQTPRSRRPMKWDQIANLINEDIKKQKGFEVRGDTLRKSILPNEARRRTKILEKWNTQIQAKELLELIRKAPPWHLP